MQFTIDINEENDNDDVICSAISMLDSGVMSGSDDLLDCLNGAYDADKRISKGADTLGRASLHSALELLDEEDYDEAEVRQLLRRGIVKRALGLKLF